MNKTYRLYIGANNTTGEVEKDKLLAILDAHFEGYTVTDSVGRWQGKNEKSVIVDIATDDRHIVTVRVCVNQILKELSQYSVGVVQLPAMQFCTSTDALLPDGGVEGLREDVIIALRQCASRIQDLKAL